MFIALRAEVSEFLEIAYLVDSTTPYGLWW
jgi:hypothetical protein